MRTPTPAGVLFTCSVCGFRKHTPGALPERWTERPRPMHAGMVMHLCVTCGPRVAEFEAPDDGAEGITDEHS